MTLDFLKIFKNPRRLDFVGEFYSCLNLLYRGVNDSKGDFVEPTWLSLILDGLKKRS
ncbi:hypothetical protein LEP1GSC060_3563 [Leptospira weilii serovar Ranarum str. ICFT]|uniref:Uncharacterized protein n=1 Tax=Leptospira weilii serovar Ranarum str. ICFT TaxID=1218598 RepID=N1WAJ8_9LEPT|nr:hypothetical protein LEP1GSC060_3563 [Leptospira weilii serovar Ranarum str. ICFT]